MYVKIANMKYTESAKRIPKTKKQNKLIKYIKENTGKIIQKGIRTEIE